MPTHVCMYVNPYNFNLFIFLQVPLPWSECPRLGPNNSFADECLKSSETEYFWYRDTLDASPSIDDNGGFKWWIVVCLILAWLVVFFIVMKGIQSSGKVKKTYFDIKNERHKFLSLFSLRRLCILHLFSHILC